MTNDIRDARFYVIVEDDGASGGGAEPLDFDAAFNRAASLVKGGSSLSVLYTEEASQLEITRFASHGIRTSLVSGA